MPRLALVGGPDVIEAEVLLLLGVGLGLPLIEGGSDALTQGRPDRLLQSSK